MDNTDKALIALYIVACLLLVLIIILFESLRMQDIYTDELPSLVDYNYKIAVLFLFILIGYAIYTGLHYCEAV